MIRLWFDAVRIYSARFYCRSSSNHSRTSVESRQAEIERRRIGSAWTTQITAEHPNMTVDHYRSPNRNLTLT